MKDKKALILVDHKKYKSQLGTVDTALHEMHISSSESFETFINRMIELGLVGIVKIT